MKDFKKYIFALLLTLFLIFTIIRYKRSATPSIEINNDGLHLATQNTNRQKKPSYSNMPTTAKADESLDFKQQQVGYGRITVTTNGNLEQSMLKQQHHTITKTTIRTDEISNSKASKTYNLFNTVETMITTLKRDERDKSNLKYTKGNVSNGERWQKMLSFLNLDSLGQCEKVFSPSQNVDYKVIMAPYYKLVEGHNKLIEKIVAKHNETTCLEDYSAKFEEQTYILLSLLRLPFVKTVCETGFNGGHSVLLWLSQNPDVQVYSFDLGDQPCSKPMAKELSKKYPGRLTVTWGNSIKTIPEFIKQHPDTKCDLLVIDGGHTYDIAKEDRDNFRKMVRSDDNIVFLDNYPDKRFLSDKLGRIWEEATRQGYIHEFFRCHYGNYKHGFTFGKYVA